VDACPTDCIHPKKDEAAFNSVNQLYVDPEGCIDLGSYSDVIVVRHHEAGGAKRAAEVSPVPIINAGNGDEGQHPTQALLDLYTIYRERPINRLSVAMIGELDKGRTERSLAYLLAKFDRIRIFFVSPTPLQMKSDIL